MFHCMFYFTCDRSLSHQSVSHRFARITRLNSIFIDNNTHARIKKTGFHVSVLGPGNGSPSATKVVLVLLVVVVIRFSMY